MGLPKVCEANMTEGVERITLPQSAYLSDYRFHGLSFFSESVGQFRE
jgi:hypothetical protein